MTVTLLDFLIVVAFAIIGTVGVFLSHHVVPFRRMPKRDTVESQSPAIWTAEDVVRFYRELGFFEGGDLADGTARLLKRFEEDHGEPLDPARPWDDVFLLSYDDNRVWADDPECDVCAENKVYTHVLGEWGKISNGGFAPTDIEEVWQDDQGPIDVHFQFDGRRHTLHPAWDNDWLDLGILASINPIIAKTGKEFVCASDGNFAVVFVLDRQSMRRLVIERRFPFLTLGADADHES